MQVACSSLGILIFVVILHFFCIFCLGTPIDQASPPLTTIWKQPPVLTSGQRSIFRHILQVNLLLFNFVQYCFILLPPRQKNWQHLSVIYLHSSCFCRFLHLILFRDLVPQKLWFFVNFAACIACGTSMPPTHGSLPGCFPDMMGVFLTPNGIIGLIARTCNADATQVCLLQLKGKR